VFTRTKENGELEAHFNTQKGRSFSLTLDPEHELIYLNADKSTSRVLVAPIFTQIFNISTKEVLKYIPAELWDKNLQAAQGQEQKAIKTLYGQLTSKFKQDKTLSFEDMVVALREAFSGSTLSAKSTSITLGKPFENITHETLLRAMANMVAVRRGDREEDNRDSLQFKRVQNLPDFLARRFEAGREHESVSKVKNKLQFNLERVDHATPKIRQVIPAKPFNKVYQNYILDSTLVSTPEETNAIESIENVGKVTVLGAQEGGISDIRAVPKSARNIDASHTGILDPSRTPESDHAGVDLRFTIAAHRDDYGTLYSTVVDNKGVKHTLSVHDLMTSVVGFPHQEGKARVQAQDHGVLSEVDSSKVQYWFPSGNSLYTVTTNLVPFLNSNHPGRLTMAGKAIPQALSLVEREEPLVQTATSGPNAPSFVRSIAQVFSTKSPVSGTVKKITPTEVHIESDSGTTHKVNLVKNLPFNMKGFLDDEAPHVAVGEKVAAGQMIAENNYTKNGVLALGKNLDVAYIPYKGFNHEDGLVISQSSADSLSSHHAYKIDYNIMDYSVLRKSLLKRYFPGKFTAEQLNQLDEQGVAQVGTILKHGDPVYAVLEKREPTAEDRMLGRLHKSLVNPYRINADLWGYDDPAEVVDRHVDGKEIRVILRAVKKLEIGDKLTGMHGNKGIVSLILPDEKMPYNKESGKPYDLLLNPASVTSRVNLGQLMEVAAAKIARKTGKPYLVQNFSKGSNVKDLSAELAHHGLSDTDEVVDPENGKTYPKVLAGPQYMMKLYKTTDQNLSARNVGGYDNVLQPTKGGHEGSKSVGYMEMLGLLGSGAKHNLQEMGTSKSEENSDYWTRFLRGQPLPKPNMTFATKKFIDYLHGSGVKVSMNDTHISATPLMDKDILGMSNGEIKNADFVAAKNLEPEDGGLFDMSVTGGIRGQKWGHYKLAEPVVNPVFEGAVKHLTGLTSGEFEKLTSGELGLKKVGDREFHLVTHGADSKVVKKVNV
jgi:DNA-directed RNA polymerase subunit beta